jgi:hypothetical protein
VLGPQPLFRKDALADGIPGGAEAGEGEEVANQVRLIEIPALQSEGWPVRGRASPNQDQRALKSSHAAEQLRGDTDLLFEDGNKAPLTQADQSRHLTGPRRWPRRTESVDADMHCRIVSFPTRQLAQQCAFQQSKPSLWSGLPRETVLELDRLASLDIR